MNNDQFESSKNNFKKMYEQSLLKFNQLEQKMQEAVSLNNERLIDYYKIALSDTFQTIKYHQSFVEFARPNFESDVYERLSIIKYFPEEMKNTIPDTVPYVFHGNSNIGQVLEIIKTGGLFTPEQRQVSLKSFASQIDVTYKNNIKVSCEFAEPNFHTFLPYGAIFVFLPLVDEYEKVLKTGDNSEVSGGVNSINFQKEDRLIGIVTTNENIEILKNYCQKHNIDSNKVFTHRDFIVKCKKMFQTNENNIETPKIR